MTTFPPTPADADATDALLGPTRMLPLRIPGATLRSDPDLLLPVPADALLDEADAIVWADLVARLGDPTTGPLSHTGCRCGQPQPGVRAVGRARARTAKAKIRGQRRRNRRR